MSEKSSLALLEKKIELLEREMKIINDEKNLLTSKVEKDISNLAAGMINLNNISGCHLTAYLEQFPEQEAVIEKIYQKLLDDQQKEMKEHVPV